MRKILVLGGPRWDAESAGVARAATLAEQADASIELFDVVYDPHLEGYLGHAEVYESLRRRIVAEREASAQDLAAKLTRRGLRCEAKTLWANPAHMAVVREAAAADVDLVVLEPKDGRRGLSHDEWRLITMCPAAVLVARSDPLVPYATIVAAIDPQRSHGKPGALDLEILERAKALRALAGARLEVVHCVAPLTAFLTYAAADESLRDTERLLRASRKQELDALITQAGLPAESAKLIDGRPDDVLAERSAADPASLIVLGSVSRGPIARLLIGSTAERVLRATSGGDVIVVKPPGFGLAAVESAG